MTARAEMVSERDRYFFWLHHKRESEHRQCDPDCTFCQRERDDRERKR
jgi:hypothetical protein